MPVAEYDHGAHYIEAIHAFLVEGFHAEDLRRFCAHQAAFQPVAHEITNYMGSKQIADAIIMHAKRHNLLNELLAWGRKKNPRQYERIIVRFLEGGPPWGGSPDTPLPPNPYRGLRTFQEKDVGLFFGRENVTERLIEAVQKQALVAVVGASGSGKSSVVYAGLLPKLRKQGEWHIVTMRPQSTPIANLVSKLLPLIEPNWTRVDQLVEQEKLTQALMKGTLSLSKVVQDIANQNTVTSPNHRLLLFVDQFEELYTLVTEGKTRQRFLDLLLAAIKTSKVSKTFEVAIVLTMRADFMGQALSYRPFADALQDNQVNIAPMTRDELEIAMVKPASLQGVGFETGLVTRILDEVGDEPGNLPLLSFALEQLWGKPTHHKLSHDTYEAIGQVKGALAQHAKSVYDKLEPAQKQEAQRLFTRLVTPGQGTQDTRRVATRAELDEKLWQLGQRLATARLLVTHQEGEEATVEVMHEALIQHWQTLQGWVEADRDFIHWRSQLQQQLRAWQKNKE